MVSQSGRIEGVAFSAPQPEALAPLFDALGAVAQPRQCLEKEAAAQRFGPRAGRAEITPFLLGRERIEIIHFPDAPLRHKVDPGPSNTLWFQHVAIVVRDLLRAAERLAPVVTPISAAPQYLPNGVGAWKFRNACGHAMELLFFPEGMGDPRWHQSGESLFQGLDHSAIAVSDSDRSLRFYVRELGLELRYASYNQGVEQQRLDDLDAAEVVIHGVGGRSGCGVEFLRYVQPEPIGPSSVDLQPQDALYAQILVRDTTLATGQLLVDPDGHRLWLHP